MKTKGLALLCAAAAVALAGGCHGWRDAKQVARRIVDRRRKHIRLPARLSSGSPALGSAFGYSHHLRLRRLWRRHRADHGAHRRLRRLSDAPLTPDQATACNGCVQIPWALSGTVDRLQHPGSSEAHQAHRRRDREDLPRHDHELERSGDREAEPEGSSSRTSRSRRSTAPTDSGTTYNFTDYLSRISAHLEHAGRHRHVGQLARRASARKRQRRRRRRPLAARRARSATPIVAYAITNHFQTSHRSRTPPGSSSTAEHTRTSQAAGRHRRRRFRQTTRSAHREPAEVGRRLRTRSPPTPTSSSRPRAANAPLLRKLIFWALTSGAEVRPDALVREDPEGRARRGREDAEAGSAQH